MTKRIAIVGGGISGLAAAYALSSGPGFDVSVFEQSERFGGKLKTDHVDGFIIEGGADSIVGMSGRVSEITTVVGLADQLITPNPNSKGAYILRKGTLHPIPEGLSGLVPTRLAPMLRTGLISPLGKLRMLLELGIPANQTPGDETLAAFARRRFGSEAYDYLLEPLLAGISSGDGRTISLRATFPQWSTAELEHGSVIRGMIASRRNESGEAAKRGFFSYRTGMETLINALCEFLKGKVRLQTLAGARRLERRETEYELVVDRSGIQRREQFDEVVIALPSWECARLLETLDAQLSRTLMDIPQRSAALVSIGFKEAETRGKLNGTGYLSPQIEGRSASAMTWSSSKWQGRAPAGHDLVRVYFGRGAGGDVVTEDDVTLIQMARDELAEIVGIRGEPVVTSVSRWKQSLPQYTIGHLERVTAIERAVARHSGLAITGNMFHGVGISRCILSAENAIAKLRTDLMSL